MKERGREREREREREKQTKQKRRRRILWMEKRGPRGYACAEILSHTEILRCAAGR